MKAMKGMNVNRMLGSLKRKRMFHIQTARSYTLTPFSTARDTDAPEGAVDPQLDTPEANALRNVVCCDSGQLQAQKCSC